jgi:hypothetical protein
VNRFSELGGFSDVKRPGRFLCPVTKHVLADVPSTEAVKSRHAFAAIMRFLGRQQIDPRMPQMAVHHFFGLEAGRIIEAAQSDGR